METPAGQTVVVLGSVNMDLVTTTARRPEPGETVLGTGFATVPGGKGANQAIAAARSGARVRFLGAVGDDAFGATLRSTLTDAGVDTTLMRIVDGPSGVATIVVDGTGENSIIVVAGANGRVTDLTSDELDAIARADILLCQLEIPLDTVAAAARHARSSGTVVALNPSPVQPLPAQLWADVDLAIVNSLEAERYSTELPEVPHVVRTRGGAGAVYRAPDGTELTVPGRRVDVVDTTGAGDAFTGALVATWAAGPPTAVTWANAAGAVATTRLGASSSIPGQDEIRALLRTG
ncbi:ribokinase [Nocardia neocaledoniensis NBRC 108232]|uniref:Ribokinase n=1 Tax=Nocardia neocaledoniensis TaxID=236511 RepID=A0A317ND19_9NOCA|nr:ribokinase [Nocardia neocaledoniensis]PWV72890.1 ribokinase [Nocardia neocaledoniensis]GEM33679.1 ribokinase [Nocardia neocaledoniensis NBRC 108232]